MCYHNKNIWLCSSFWVRLKTFWITLVCVCVCVCIYIYIYIHTHTRVIQKVLSLTQNEEHSQIFLLWTLYTHTHTHTHIMRILLFFCLCVCVLVQSQVESYQRFKKWYLMLPCLTLSIIRYISRVKWSNPGKGVASSPTPWCSSYRKGSLWVTLD